MPERRSVRLKVPSERLRLLQQSMDDGVKKRKRVIWKPGEKEAMLALRDKYPKMLLKEFQETYYPDRAVKALSGIICQMRKEARKEKVTNPGSEDDLRSSTPTLPDLKRPRKSGPFEFSDSEEEDSGSDEGIEDIDPSGHRTPNKFIKVSHSAEAQSPQACHVEQRESMIRSQRVEIALFPKQITACLPRPQTPPPEVTNVVHDTNTGWSEANSSSMCMSRIGSIGQDISRDEPAPCDDSAMQMNAKQDKSDGQAQSQALKEEEAYPEHHLRQESAKESAEIFAKVQSQMRREEKLHIRIKQLLAENSILQKKCDMIQLDNDSRMKEINEIKITKELEIAQLNEKWQAERDALKRENETWNKRFEVVKSAFDVTIGK